MGRNTRSFMEKEKKPENVEKIVGYIILSIGLIFIVLPALLAFSMLLSGAQIPQFVPVPPEENEFATAFVSFSNVCLVFFMFIVMVWVGSIITSRGITLIKDVKLKLVRKSVREAREIAEKLEKKKS
jgi:ABC-type lipoprotein release transport system permease subunit